MSDDDDFMQESDPEQYFDPSNTTYLFANSILGMTSNTRMTMTKRAATLTSRTSTTMRSK